SKRKRPASITRRSGSPGEPGNAGTGTDAGSYGARQAPCAKARSIEHTQSARATNEEKRGASTTRRVELKGGYNGTIDDLLQRLASVAAAPFALRRLRPSEPMRAMILAAGRGERMGALT